MKRRSLLFKSFIATFAYIGLSNKSQSADVTQIPANKEQNNLRPPVSVDNSNFQIVSALSKPTGLALIGQCESINELRTIIPENHGQRISVKGYYPSSNEGGGVFYYDENDKTSKDNDGTIIISKGRRWKRENTYLMEPEFFGAKGDGSTDDTTALQNALDASINKVLILAPKKYRARNLFIKGPLIIKGAGRRIDAALIPLDGVSGNFITISCPESPTFYDLTISARNVNQSSPLNGLYIAKNDTKQYSPSILMYNCNINSFSGHCLLSEYGRHMGVLDNCQFEYSHDDCIVINGVDWNISHCAIGYTKNGNGVVLGQPTNRISNSDIYFNRRNGIVLKNNAINGYLASNVINSNGEHGIVILSKNPSKQGHLIVNNFFFNNSKSQSGQYSNIFLSKNIHGVGITGNSHFTYSEQSERPKHLLELSDGASASLIGDSFNKSSYMISPVNGSKSTIINNEYTTLGSETEFKKIVSNDNSKSAFIVENTEARRKILEITNRGEFVFYDHNNSPLTISASKIVDNSLELNCSLAIGSNEADHDKIYFLKLGDFYIWDDSAGNIRIHTEQPHSKTQGNILYQTKSH
ncbi:pectate lyase superfamily protein [Klebsiella pneumoniae]|uniref:right-handed parallel beta-helix repeat-containing protein n=3 Tax=Klebsiella pneumoniae TaxID=573 RepID=UPI0020041E9F|nr:right-handed parallel beta-helix repeat-containing protein [Klebsiella pneumoniae]MCK6022476.1 right-handed parallel beta-helix repeat-containing protein [Klebsiella pneumoniae]MCK6024782.1 right-handed parallel beta-helix repeat-containing protein [Klebsiella pneumoniae]MDG5840222.1 pectate lyase superfamily protein [Klebsiella pneumoniae]MDG5859028.1 pectate lyase superfamily protein [Klebsiella pneumoniae]MDK9476912.1 pectate lyase superfamily protein [Klebsiella pneumoniae]